VGRHPGGSQLKSALRPGRRLAAAGLVVLAALLAGPGCSDGRGRGAAAPVPPSSAAPPDTSPPDSGSGGATPASPAEGDTGTTVTTGPTAPAPTTTTVPADGSLVPGMEGDAVRGLQTRLVALHYDPGPVDARYGGALASAVMAFQKVAGLARTGRASPDVLAAVAAAADPTPMLADGGPTRVEVDLKRQVLLYWRDRTLLRILPVSTGTGRHYCEDGDCGVAVTPGGSFRIERRIRGPHKSPLGLLYDPLFFVGGYAIHGSPSVPAYPASHGCVRIPMHVSGWFYDNVPNGTPVYVFGGRNPPTPFPPDAPPAPPPIAPPPAPAEPATTTTNTTTTTTAPPPSSPPSTAQPATNQRNSGITRSAKRVRVVRSG
jgi:lipoprotein-anchoring transpeptidase ErfK/SrfK